jgi:tetratricopeptide (TPR) repeat protein
MRRWLLLFTHLSLGNLEHALSWQEPGLQCLRERFDLRWCAWSFAAASMTYVFLGRWDEAVEEARKELTIAEEYHDDSLVAYANFNMSNAYTAKGDAAKAVEYGQIAFEKAPTPADALWAQTWLGWAWCRAGRAREGGDLLTSLLPMYDAGQFVYGQVFIRMFLSEAYWRTGQLDQCGGDGPAGPRARDPHRGQILRRFHAPPPRRDRR